MSRLIDADELKEAFTRHNFWPIPAIVYRILDSQPTVDAEPVRHGRWIDCDYKKFEHGVVETYPNKGKCCSNCRTGFKADIVIGYDFCPNCGARMDGGNEDGT